MAVTAAETVAKVHFVKLPAGRGANFGLLEECAEPKKGGGLY